MLKVGLQLVSVKNALKDDFENTLKRVSEIGYKYVEFLSRGDGITIGDGVRLDMPAEEVKKLLDQYGLTAVGVNLRPEFIDTYEDGKLVKRDLDYEAVDYKNFFDYQKKMGNRNIVITLQMYENYEHVLACCAAFNRIGRLCKENGMKLLYHNQNQVGQSFNGELVLDIIANNTDPELVFFELDTFWLLRGGLDAVDVIKKLGKRVTILHQKDFPKNAKEPINVFEFVDPNVPLDYVTFHGFVRPECYTEIGTGIIDLQAMVDAANEYTDAEYILLEHDRPVLVDELKSVAESMENFRKYKGLEF